MIRRLLAALRRRTYARGGIIGRPPAGQLIPMRPGEAIFYDPSTHQIIHWIDGQGATRITPDDQYDQEDQ